MPVQFTKEEWKKYVRAALKNWQRLDKLNQNPLTEMETVSRQLETSPYVNDPYKKALALREIMRSAITTLGVEGEEPPDQDDPRWLDDVWRPYLILTLLQRHKTATVSDMLLMAGGNYFDVQGESIELLAKILHGWEIRPIPKPIFVAYSSGAVEISDPCYIERGVDAELRNALKRRGNTVTIRGSRQVGKTSLLIRGMHEAQENYGAHVVYFDLQGVGGAALESLDAFLRAIANWIFDDLGLDLDIVRKVWDSDLAETQKLTNLLSHHVLSQIDGPVLLAMDEIDRLQRTSFHSDFFGLVRSWHNLRAYPGKPQWAKLSIIMAISTEPYLLIADLNQSPFNVGRRLKLEDFSESQVTELNRRYGSPLSKEDLSHIIELLNGHPFLTRMAFYTMLVEKPSWKDFEAMAPSDQGPFGDHLQHQYRLLMSDPALRKALREIAHGMHCSDEKAGFRLMKAGLVVKEPKRYVCRCELYRQYFADKL